MTLKAADAKPVTEAVLGEIDRLGVKPALAALALAYSLAIVVHGSAKSRECREGVLMALVVEMKGAMRTLDEIDRARSTH
ncbi:hypothetical protein [Elioraea sp.]|uniref:hypothetical protein n=1 Tax=Elioraea sp. TaxID=2185103 RepID=UPI0021DE5E4D|nr:hypothetical protein [Elioraea sp.]GIX10344.1 MAG: hypothetical protein KatS3mg116_2054 [Elioraea sp.]